MITTIKKVKTRLAIIHNIPKKFFSELENSTSFGNHLFPKWIDTVFASTSLKKKFEILYNAYKAIPNKTDRDLIIAAFENTNKVEELCNNSSSVRMIVLKDLHIDIRKPIDDIFLYLYDDAINYHKFQNFVDDDTLFKTISRFTFQNKIVVCPFCGIESFINISGQARLPLDHWLNKDVFPMSAVNLNNLVPIGKDCNPSPVKGAKNVLIDENTNLRIKAFYPYSNHQSIIVKFSFINEPTSKIINDADWKLEIKAKDASENDIFNNWKSIFNIEGRYKDYIRQYVFPMWESYYKEHIEDEDNDLKHATCVSELKDNLKNWKSIFKVKGRPGSLLYRAFIEYLINDASDSYLKGLSLNFNSVFYNKKKIGFIEKVFGVKIEISKVRNE